MTRLIGRRLAMRTIAIGSDQIVAAFPIPRGGTLNSLFLDTHLIAQDGASLATHQMAVYSIAAYVVPVPDPDAQLTFEAAWDRLVPKDTAVLSQIDLDTTAADTNPESEPGEVDLSQLFNMTGLNPRKIFARHKYLTYANSMGAVGGAALDNWHPADHFTTTIRRKVRCSMYSYALVAVSSPFMAAHVTAVWDSPTEAEWGILQYLDVFIEQMFIASLGLLESGAESPYEEAEQFIHELLEDSLVEDTTDAFHPLIWNAFCRSTFDISVPGRPQLKTLTSS